MKELSDADLEAIVGGRASKPEKFFKFVKDYLGRIDYSEFFKEIFKTS